VVSNSSLQDNSHDDDNRNKRILETSLKKHVDINISEAKTQLCIYSLFLLGLRLTALCLLASTLPLEPSPWPELYIF
jgi:hypothetical protein